jgi:hypothetical protein
MHSAGTTGRRVYRSVGNIDRDEVDEMQEEGKHEIVVVDRKLD